MDRRAMVEQLRSMGLTAYESKCYVALAQLGPSDPRKIASEAKIPYPSAYEALKRLTEKGWVEVVTKKPAAYKARKPGSVREMIVPRIVETFDSLERIYNPEPAEETELVHTIRGRDRVLAKIYELLAGARSSVMIVAPTMGLEDGRLLQLLELALARHVKVRAVGDEEASGLLPPGTEIRTGSLVSVDLLVDDKTALISLPDYSACGWIDSPAVASQFKQFLELLWNTSSPD